MLQPILDLPQLQKTKVLYIWAIAILTIFVIAFLWFVLDSIVTPMLDLQTVSHPVEMSDSGVTFINALWIYWPVIALLGLGIWVYVMSQKQRMDDLRGE